jgi:mannosyltransferase OCH1-like enzyme
MIPKIVHYCWFGSEIPTKQKEVVDNWIKLMPDYRFMCWGNEIAEKCNLKFINQAMRKKHYAFVADYFRLKMVYEYGGFYLDTDMMLIKNLNSLCNLDFVICSEVEGRPAWGFFGANQGNPFLKQSFERYKNLEYDQFKPPVIPYFLLESILEYLKNDVAKRINLAPMFFYPMPVERASENHEKFINSQTIGVHLWDFSWLEIKLERTKISELVYRFKTLFVDFLNNDYSLYYYKINLIRILRILGR